MAQQLTYRVAVPDDEAGILTVFAEVAPEVPTAVRPQTKAIIHRCVSAGGSWVAVEPKGAVVGYALVMSGSSEPISLTYLGVAKAARNQHICSTLVSKLKEKGVTITASVRHNNASSMADRFKSLGFAQGKVSEGGTKFHWEPPASEASDLPTP